MAIYSLALQFTASGISNVECLVCDISSWIFTERRKNKKKKTQSGRRKVEAILENDGQMDKQGDGLMRG